MSLQTELGYPIGGLAALIGALRQIQRWLPRYEWVTPHHVVYYATGITLSTLLIGGIAAFAVGVRVDRHLDHSWSLVTAASTAIIAGIVGMGIGTALTFFLHPGFNTVLIDPLIAFVGVMASYVASQGFSVGVAGLAGLALSRIHATEHDTASTESTTQSKRSPKTTDRTDTDAESERLSIAETDSRFR